MSALLGIFIGPVLGSVVDAFGPRSTLLLSAACSTLRPIVFLALPNVAGLVISEILNAQNCAMVSGQVRPFALTLRPPPPCCLRAVFPLRSRLSAEADGEPAVQTQAALANMFRGDPTRMVAMMSRFFMVPWACMTVLPIIGGALATVSPRLPFVVAAAAGLVSGALALPVRDDTSIRTPFSWLKSTPLSALTLFTHGRYLRSLAIVHVITRLTETSRGSISSAAAESTI